MAKDIFEMAWDVVLPDGGNSTELQENEVQALVDFGRSVLKEFCPTQRALDFAICAPEYHVSLDEQGDIYCRMCGRPLSQ